MRPSLALPVKQTPVVLAAIAHPADTDKPATHPSPCYDLIRQTHPAYPQRVNTVTAVLPCVAAKINRVYLP